MTEAEAITLAVPVIFTVVACVAGLAVRAYVVKKFPSEAYAAIEEPRVEDRTVVSNRTLILHQAGTNRNVASLKPDLFSAPTSEGPSLAAEGFVGAEAAALIAELQTTDLVPTKLMKEMIGIHHHLREIEMKATDEWQFENRRLGLHQSDEPAARH